MNNDQNNQNETRNEQGNANQNGDQYYNPNGQYYNPNGQYYNPNGQYYNPNNGGQFNPDSFFNPYQRQDSCGKTAQTFGIVALVGILFCWPLAIIFGALAMSNAKRSAAALRYECPEAKTGRIMGLIGLILGIAQAAIVVLAYILLFFGIIPLAGLL
jgi:ABC-type phosphate/phosphonate transport system permease subunit